MAIGDTLTRPYTVAPEVTEALNNSIGDQLQEIIQGYNSICKGASRLELLQGIGRIEAACRRLTALAPRLK